MLKKLFSAGAALIFMVSSAGALEWGMTPVSNNSAHQVSAVNPVAQLTQTSKDDDGFCTVFYIGNSRFATAGHCAIDADTPMHILFQDGTFRRLDVEIIAVSNPMKGMPDFAVLEASSDAQVFRDLKPLPLDCGYTAQVGAGIHVEGFPADLGFITTWGKVAGKTAKWAVWDKPVIRTNVSISNGNSGGPTFDDATGKVIGIAVGALPKNQNLSAVQPITPICRLLGIK